MRRSPLALVGAAVLAAGLAYGTGTALAQTDTGSGTCPALTAAQSIRDQAFVADANADQAVTSDRADLDTANAALASAKSTLSADKAARQAAAKALADAKVTFRAAAPEDKAAAQKARDDAQDAFDATTPKVTADQTALTTAQSNVTTAQNTLAAAQAKAADTQTALDQAQTALNGTTCPAPASTTPPVGTTGNPPAPAVTVFTDDKNCADFSSQDAAQAYFLTHRSGTQPDPDRLDANNNGIACEAPADEATLPPRTVTHSTTEINNGTVVNPTSDDGSTATTSGSEVTDVPDGSAQTGAA